MAQPKKRKRRRPLMFLRIFDPRDDRIGGNEDDCEDGYEDKYEESSPSLNDKSLSAKPKHGKSS